MGGAAFNVSVKMEDTVPLTCIVVLHKFRPARMEQYSRL